jgi:transketolase
MIGTLTAGLTGYGDMLFELGADRSKLVVIDAGLGTSMQTARFARAFPDRYFNLGIAEQNAVGVASGLARRGFVPLVHSFSNFLARRAHDQVALSVAWPACGVKLIGGSCGVFDGRNGPSHFAFDDLAVMSALPGVFVAEAADWRQLRDVLATAVDFPGPAYLRVRRNGAPADLVPEAEPCIGTITVRQQPRALVTIVAGGSILAEVILASHLLVDVGLPVDVVHVSVLRPLDAAPIIASARRTGSVVVVENHCATGGFGDAVGRVLGPLGVRHQQFALPDAFLPAGDPEWLLGLCGLDGPTLAHRIQAVILEAHRV